MKIHVYLNKAQFEYDIHSLIKAFYPEADVKVFTSPEVRDGGDLSFSLLFKKDCIEFFREDLLMAKALIGEDSERTTVKNEVKALIYKALSKELGELPWGDLTGIRPTKIARQLLEEGESEDKVKNYMSESYFVSDEKTNLSIDIAKREIEILTPIHYETGYSLYIGIPFCPTTCLYCSFPSNSISVWKKRVDDYIEALKKELCFTAEAMKTKNLDTVYIGGGTPTTLEADELDRLLTFIAEKFDTDALLEYTVEAGRADSITIDKLKVLKKHKVTRISVNPQTMNQRTLDLIGRRHRVEDVERAFYDARSQGFDNINMDIILGLPEEGPKEVSKTIEDIVRLNPDSLTIHSLAIKRASRMQTWIEERGLSTMINTDETMRIARMGALKMDMKPYYLYRQKNMVGNFENVGYAKEGCFGIYNILIMEEKQNILACGAGTVTKRVFEDGRIERCDAVKDVSLYIDKIDEMIERKRKLFA